MTDHRVSAPARLAGLDGLRAVAVSLVVVYHLFPSWWLPAGFVGVDVFFVISGFLITTLLLDESDRDGRIALVPFWRRRARRLLPALALLVTACATAAWVIGGDVLAKMGAQVAGAATFSYNWVSIATGAGYFGTDTPEVFRNLWSLAVEEQFYVLWPLVLPLFLLIPRTWVRTAVALIAALGSAVWMGALAAGAVDPTRAYFGTDSHAFGILLGVALAFGARRVLRAAAGRAAGPVSLVAGLAAVAGIVAVAAIAPADGVAAFPGALLAASMLSVVAIAAGVWPRSWFGRTIDVAPLRWVGDRSYGIYLWHWPLLVLIVAGVAGDAPEGDIPLPLSLTTLAATVVLAELSYRFVELPVRRLGFRGSLAVLGARLTGGPASRFAALSGLAAWVLVIGGTAAAVAAAPALTSAEIAVQAGQDALDTDDSSPSPAGTTTPTPTAPSASASGTPTAPGVTPTPQPSPPAVPGTEITAIGDSVMLASAKGLLAAFPGISIDAKVSRSMWAAPGILRKLDAKGKLRPYIVIALGTNGPVAKGPMAEILDIAGPDRTVVLVNAFAPRSWIPGVNRDLARFAASRPNVVVADWSRAIRSRTDLLAGDHIHPGTAGGRIFAAAVADAIDRARVETAVHRGLDALDDALRTVTGAG